MQILIILGILAHNVYGIILRFQNKPLICHNGGVIKTYRCDAKETYFYHGFSNIFINSKKIWECICPWEFYGESCERKFPGNVDLCQYHPCTNKGFCENLIDEHGREMYNCTCTEEFKGKTCRIHKNATPENESHIAQEMKEIAIRVLVNCFFFIGVLIIWWILLKHIQQSSTQPCSLQNKLRSSRV